MRPNEAFKLGFLTRCVEEGLSPEDTVKLVKSASDCFNKESGIVSDTIGTAGKVIGSLGTPALIGAAALPPALGGLAAYFHNKATDTDAEEVEEVKKKELIQTYQRMADQLRRHKKLQNQRTEKKRTGQVFL